MTRSIALLTLSLVALGAGCGRHDSDGPLAGDADAKFQEVADRLVGDFLKRNPTAATQLGVHDYNTAIEDVSRQAEDAEVGAPS
jgi:hypothetical protein